MTRQFVVLMLFGKKTFIAFLPNHFSTGDRYFCNLIGPVFIDKIKKNGLDILERGQNLLQTRILIFMQLG